MVGMGNVGPLGRRFNLRICQHQACIHERLMSELWAAGGHVCIAGEVGLGAGLGWVCHQRYLGRLGEVGPLVSS